ncbi:MAG TPA: hypothetical protein VLQ89_07735 [Candidatus Binatia bacterium]|nr:hypothetical protein [Candidatus Binatia bacterium]
MKKILAVVLLFCLGAAVSGAELCYRLEYRICGSAISRLLFFFPLRLYYDTSASIQFTAHLQADGRTRFVFENITDSAYLVRTLGFSGKTLALLSADTDDVRAGLKRDDVLASWLKEAPEFSGRIKNVKQFPHRLLKASKEGLSFTRDSEGRYSDFSIGLETRYRLHPAHTGIYFNVFPMLENLLGMLNHPFTPGMEMARIRQFPDAWNGSWLDFSRDLNRLGERLEKVVKSLVTVEQQAPFRLVFRMLANGPEEAEICGEAFPDVPVWKNFMIREVRRRVKVRPADGVLLLDEIWVGIRNTKGQGGFGRLQLKRIDHTEDHHE